MRASETIFVNRRLPYVEAMMSAMKRPFDQLELGVEFFIGKGPGLGYRELDGRLWFGPIGRSIGHLMPEQMLTVISAAGVPLPGWEPNLPADWFSCPRRQVAPGQKQPAEVMRAFRDVVEPIDKLLSSLTGLANAVSRRALKSRAAVLSSGSIESIVSTFDAPDAKRAFVRDQFLAAELAETRSAIAAAREFSYRAKRPGELGSAADLAARLSEVDLRIHAMRLDFTAKLAASEERVKKPMVHLMQPLVKCFRQIFDRDAARRWEQGDDADGNPISQPAGPFPPFASALLHEAGLSYTPKSLHRYLGEWVTLQRVK